MQDKWNYFRQNWQQEGLSWNWWNISDVGFSMQRQMRLLEGLDREAVSKWTNQTEMDFRGFAREYLMRGNVFPFEYAVDGDRLVDKRYGNRSLLDTVDPKEREEWF